MLRDCGTRRHGLHLRVGHRRPARGGARHARRHRGGEGVPRRRAPRVRGPPRRHRHVRPHQPRVRDGELGVMWSVLVLLCGLTRFRDGSGERSRTQLGISGAISAVASPEYSHRLGALEKPPLYRGLLGTALRARPSGLAMRRMLIVVGRGGLLDVRRARANRRGIVNLRNHVRPPAATSNHPLELPRPFESAPQLHSIDHGRPRRLDAPQRDEGRRRVQAVAAALGTFFPARNAVVRHFRAARRRRRRRRPCPRA